MHLTLFLPGLFGPGTRFSEEFIPRADALEMLLSRGDLRRSPRQSFHRTLSLLFGYAADNGRDVAVAAVTRLLDAGEAPAGCWMRADPVCLVPDRHGLVLMDAASLGLNMQDALALAAEIRPALRIADCELEVPAPERWYLHIDDAPALCTCELDSVVGQDIQSALPTGSDAARWHRLLNEIQMLMHGSGVNRDREARSLPAINSLWFWGVGELPAPAAAEWSAVYAGDLFARGLGRLARIPVNSVPGGAEPLAATAAGADRVLVILDDCSRAARYRDLERWSAALAGLERNWFQPAVRLLRRGALARLELITEGWTVSVHRAALMKFWRRRAPLRRFALER